MTLGPVCCQRVPALHLNSSNESKTEARQPFRESGPVCNLNELHRFREVSVHCRFWALMGTFLAGVNDRTSDARCVTRFSGKFFNVVPQKYFAKHSHRTDTTSMSKKPRGELGK